MGLYTSCSGTCGFRDLFKVSTTQMTQALVGQDVGAAVQNRFVVNFEIF